jgi:isopenicillin-N N-acyltransferase-like protein
VLRVVVAEGGPAERGRTIGRALGDLIARSLEFYRGYFAASSLPSPGLEPYRLAATALPEESALIDAIAAGAEVDPLELWTVNAVEEAEQLVVERCTSFTALAPGVTLLGHNEQWMAGDAENIAVVIEVPPDGPALVSPTVACCLPSVGWNTAGIAQGIDSLTAPDDRVGIPRVLVSRHALAARDLDDAVARASMAGRAGGYAHVLAAKGGRALTLETSATRAWTTDGPGGHTNHYLAGEGDESSDGSRARFERLSKLLSDRPPQGPEDAMDVLRDHASSPQAICKHGTLGDDEASVVLFSMVCELEKGRMWVAPGNPCVTPYEEVDLAALAR